MFINEFGLKLIYAVCFLSLIFYTFVCVFKGVTDNEVNILSESDIELAVENVFPFSNEVKEIYGLSNKIISPNEKVTGSTAIIKDGDGFLFFIGPASIETVDYAKNKIVELNDYCHSLDTEFAFIYYPSKSNSNVISTEYGIDTNLEEIRYDFISYLEKNGIDYLHIRELLEGDGYKTKDVFYKTDHHWTTNAGLYSARAIVNYLNDEYGYRLNNSDLDENEFSYIYYDDLWFGETGRSLSRSWVGTLDGFTQIMPKNNTSISQIYADGTRVDGDFSIMVDDYWYDKENINYYDFSAHYTYAKGMAPNPVIYHNNYIDENGKKILIIKDSFSIVVIPFLTLAVEDIAIWDMREVSDSDSLYEYIKDNNFDAVLLAYNDFWAEHMWNFS